MALIVKRKQTFFFLCYKNWIWTNNFSKRTLSPFLILFLQNIFVSFYSVSLEFLTFFFFNFSSNLLKSLYFPISSNGSWIVLSSSLSKKQSQTYLCYLFFLLDAMWKIQWTIIGHNAKKKNVFMETSGNGHQEYDCKWAKIFHKIKWTTYTKSFKQILIIWKDWLL